MAPKNFFLGKIVGDASPPTTPFYRKIWREMETDGSRDTEADATLDT